MKQFWILKLRWSHSQLNRNWSDEYTTQQIKQQIIEKEAVHKDDITKGCLVREKSLQKNGTEETLLSTEYLDEYRVHIPYVFPIVLQCVFSHFKHFFDTFSFIYSAM